MKNSENIFESIAKPEHRWRQLVYASNCDIMPVRTECFNTVSLLSNNDAKQLKQTMTTFKLRVELELAALGWHYPSIQHGNSDYLTSL